MSRFSAHATLVGIRVKVRKQKVLELMEQEVQIAQEIVKYTAKKDAEPGLAGDTQQKLGIMLHNATCWENTKRYLS